MEGINIFCHEIHAVLSKQIQIDLNIEYYPEIQTVAIINKIRIECLLITDSTFTKEKEDGTNNRPIFDNPFICNVRKGNTRYF